MIRTIKADHRFSLFSLHFVTVLLTVCALHILLRRFAKMNGRFFMIFRLNTEQNIPSTVSEFLSVITKFHICNGGELVLHVTKTLKGIC